MIVETVELRPRLLAVIQVRPVWCGLGTDGKDHVVIHFLGPQIPLTSPELVLVHRDEPLPAAGFFSLDKLGIAGGVPRIAYACEMKLMIWEQTEDGLIELLAVLDEFAAEIIKIPPRRPVCLDIDLHTG